MHIAIAPAGALGSARIAAQVAMLPLAALGDSLLHAGSSDVWPLLLSSYYPTRNATYQHLDAVGGEDSAQCFTRFDAALTLYQTASWILWPGRNDVRKSGGCTAFGTAERILSEVYKLGHGRFKVLEIISGDNSDEYDGTTNGIARQACNAKLKDVLGSKFIPLMAPLLAAGTGTGQDLIDTNRGITPTSMRQAGDPVHLTLNAVSGAASGNYLVCQQIINNLNTYGWN